MSLLSPTIEYQERVAPSRPSRLGTRRRKPRQAVSALPEAGASRSGGARAPSLDTGNHLATTVRECRENRATQKSKYKQALITHRDLKSSFHAIWQKHAIAGRVAEAAKWEKGWLRLRDCQKEWVGYRADCCKGFTAPIAVPIGCNHRLCPLCCYHRSQKARKKVKTMFDRLHHPAMITLTTPNLKTLRKHDFTLFRERVRAFIAQYADRPERKDKKGRVIPAQKGLIKGGVYSLETTYNRKEKTWHLHTHILADFDSSLPHVSQKIDFVGQRTFAFMAIKLRMEFDWLRLWTTQWGKEPATNARLQTVEGDRYRFEEWVRIGRTMAVKEWDYRLKRMVAIPLSEAEFKTRHGWNKEHRRLVDVRPVNNRDGAAREVLKYITKVAAFNDLPDAVEEFCNATRGARLIQTFGSWYGVKLDEEPDPNQVKDWGELTCKCGVNWWRRMGIFHRSDVEMDDVGRWHLKAPLDHRSAGTVPRPTIRALDVREEWSDGGLQQTQPAAKFETRLG